MSLQARLSDLVAAIGADIKALQAGGVSGSMSKADPYAVVFVKTGAGAVSIKAGTRVDVAGTTVTFGAETPVAMPALTAGTDYAVWVKSDGTIQASANHSAPPASGEWLKIGGFYYALGGNAAGQAGGDTTPAINEYSIWDLKWRPACPDPRGMTLVAGVFWADIYLLGVNHHTDGTSRAGATIADNNSPPKIPAAFGGNGSATYSGLTWWDASEVLMSHGKRLPDYAEFAALAYGVTEASSIGVDQVTTKLNAAYTSRWGVMQATGVMFVWGRDTGGGEAAASWAANTSGRGSTLSLPTTALFGGDWSPGAQAGSRSSRWNLSHLYSTSGIGVRGVCEHVVIL